MVRAPVAASFLLLLAAAAPAWAQRSKRPTLVILGDSFSDDGNGLPPTNETVPSAAQGYYMERMSNGPIWSDYISYATGVQLVNVAVKGSTACPAAIPNNGLPFFVPDLGQQAQMVVDMEPNISTKRAVIIFTGVNDISVLAQAMLMGQINFTQAMAAVPGINACLKQNAEALVRYGFTKQLTVITAPNTPFAPLWSVIFSAFNVPPAASGPFLQGVGALLRAYNEGMKRDMDDLASKYRRASFAVYDLFNLVSAVILEPHAYGFTNVTAACQPYSPFMNVPGTPGNTILSTCPDPQHYMFWDYQHLTTAFHAILGKDVQHSLALSTDLFV